MKNRWVTGFTVVELVIIIAVIAILATVVSVSFGKVRDAAAVNSIKSDLTAASTAMNSYKNTKNEYPSTLPASFSPSKTTTITLVSSASLPYYRNLTNVQNGTLFAQMCADLVAEGKGKGVDQGGVTRDYIQSCGNWNYNGMQITGWDSKNWTTPISKQDFLAYADGFYAVSSWHKAQEPVVKNFYHAMVDRLEQRGGSFPITSFWDFWATPSNGGVMQQPLDPNTASSRSTFCIEGTAEATNARWRVREDAKVEEGSC